MAVIINLRLFRHPISLFSALLVLCSPCTAAAKNKVIGMNNQGVKALNAKNFDEAIKFFEKALAEDPNYLLARENLAIAHNNYGLALQKKPAAALSHFYKAFLLNMSNEVTAKNIDGILTLMGKKPTSLFDRLGLARAAKARGDLVGAFVEYKMAQKLGRSSEVEKMLDETRLALGKLNLAPYSMIVKEPWRMDPKNLKVKEPSEYSPFMYSVQRRIKRSWIPITVTESKRTVVKFKILPSGEIVDLRISKSSGLPTLDSEALAAVKNSSPFPTEGFGITVPLEIMYTFDCHPSYKPSIESEIADGHIPTEKELLLLKNLKEKFPEKARIYAESFEQFGLFEEAQKLYERISSKLESAPKPSVSKIENNKRSIERVTLFKEAIREDDRIKLESEIVSCLLILEKSESLSSLCSESLRSQLVNRMIVCKIDLSKVTEKISSSLDLSLNTKVSLFRLLNEAAIKNSVAPLEQKKIAIQLDNYIQAQRELAIADELNSRALRYEINDSYTEALKLYEEASGIKKKWLGTQSKDVLIQEADIGRVLAAQGKLAQSKIVFETAINSLSKIDEQDYRLVRLLQSYGDVLSRTKQAQSATEVYARAAALKEHRTE